MPEVEHNFKFPQIYAFLLTVTHAEISEDGGYHGISCILREKFTCLMDMEEYEWEIVDDSGGKKIIKFSIEMKQMIFLSCSEKDKSIYRERQNIPRSLQHRTERQKYVVKECKNIVDKIHKKYLRICVNAFGPLCGMCRDKSKSSFHTNCKCELGICKDCLHTIIQSNSGNTGSFALCYNKTCHKRINTFTTRSGKDHSITSLFGYKEYDSDEEENVVISHEENGNELPGKRIRQNSESTPLSSHTAESQPSTSSCAISKSTPLSSHIAVSQPSTSSCASSERNPILSQRSTRQPSTSSCASSESTPLPSRIAESQPSTSSCASSKRNPILSQRSTRQPSTTSSTSSKSNPLSSDTAESQPSTSSCASSVSKRSTCQPLLTSSGSVILCLNVSCRDEISLLRLENSQLKAELQRYKNL